MSTMFEVGDEVTAKLRFTYWDFIHRRVVHEVKVKKATVTSVDADGVYRIKLGRLDGRSCLALEHDLERRR
jgi:uncharacterized protein YodC (DUF2158 family)